jgi:ABC-type Fe3+ transport system substrate-binding protein
VQAHIAILLRRTLRRASLTKTGEDVMKLDVRKFYRGLLLAAVIMLPSVRTEAADQALIDAAKKEGRLTWYTTLIVDQFVRPVTDAFEKKYGIKTEYTRADHNEVALRILNEGKAGKMQADIFDGFSQVVGLDREGFVTRWSPEAAKRYPKHLFDPQGRWIASNLYVLTPGYNTDLVAKGAQPKTFEDLLDPKWKGKLAWSINTSPSGAAGFIGAVLSYMGEEKGMVYLRKLATQNITGVRVSARQLLDQVIAGEYPIALQIFNYHPGISAAKGAHVDWIKMQPALAALGIVSITKPAPHENAAKLFVDFLTSPEGQGMFRNADYMPVDPQVSPRDPALRPDGEAFKATYLTPEQLDSEVPKWAKIYEQIFR